MIAEHNCKKYIVDDNNNNNESRNDTKDNKNTNKNDNSRCIRTYAMHAYAHVTTQKVEST